MCASPKKRSRARPDLAGYAWPDLLPMTRTCLEAGIAVLLRGHPGVGKSALAAELARQVDLPMVDIRLAQREPAEIGGVYFPDRDNGELALLPPPWVRAACARPHLVFLDEINAAVTRLHQAAAYQVVLERRVGPFRFHADTMVLAAGNLEEDHAIVTSLSSALNNRFAHFRLRVDTDAWLRWAEDNRVEASIVAYLRANHSRGAELLYDNHGGDAFPTPRSWAMASAVLRRARPEHARRLVAACIGAGAAERFFLFGRIWGRVKPERIIDKGRKVDFTSGRGAEPSFAIAAVTAVGHWLAEQAEPKSHWIRNLVAFMRSPGLDPEYVFVLLRDLRARTNITELLKAEADYRQLAAELVGMHVGMFR